MLEYLLLEIRNLDEKELSYAPKLAYLFHNIPSLLLHDFDEREAEHAYQVMLGRAEALGLKSWFDVCEQRTISKLTSQTKSLSEP
jgi:hypothetical protein